MPELPEVETTLRGISPHIQGKKVVAVIIRQPQLRWPITDCLPSILPEQRLHRLSRRAKYLLLQFDTGVLLIHLGMSGSLRIIDAQHPVGKHDHIDVVFQQQKGMRLTDPRRFGAVLWIENEALTRHFLLCKLGVEPLSTAFSAAYLHQKMAQRRVTIKTFLMNQQVVTGIGNIYCAESLFAAGINPQRTVASLSFEACVRLVASIKRILLSAIEQGGTTLRDFVGSDGKAGYFQQTLNVYGRGGQACVRCGAVLVEIKQAGRATVYCEICQS